MKGIKLLNPLSVYLLALVMCLGFATQTSAHGGKYRASKQRLELNFGDWHLRGKNTIFLKRELRHHYPHLRLKDYDIRKVVMVAKTKHGMGTASLRVGDGYSSRRVVDGYPESFHHSYRNYDRVKFRNPNPGAHGPWQIRLRGNFKVRKVVVVLTPKYKRRHRHHDHRNDRHDYGHKRKWYEHTEDLLRHY